MLGRRCALVSVTLLLLGCRPAVDANEPLAGERELCCREVDDDNAHFRGCRVGRSCRTTEAVWVRGPLRCGPVEPDRCAGGRCCSLDLAAIDQPPATVELTATARNNGASGQASSDVSAATESAPPLLTPVPLDWQPRPIAVFVPKLVCPSLAPNLATEAGERTVVLELEIDAQGQVTAADVVEGLDPECDALARDALLRAEFEPATRPSGEAMATQLRFRYEFAGASQPGARP